jgi:hypothetical protein
MMLHSWLGGSGTQCTSDEAPAEHHAGHQLPLN